jgi:hypothetical protein
MKKLVLFLTLSTFGFNLFASSYDNYNHRRTRVEEPSLEEKRIGLEKEEITNNINKETLTLENLKSLNKIIRELTKDGQMPDNIKLISKIVVELNKLQTEDLTKFEHNIAKFIAQLDTIADAPVPRATAGNSKDKLVGAVASKANVAAATQKLNDLFGSFMAPAAPVAPAAG